MNRAGLLFLGAALLTSACSSGDNSDDVPPLPEQTAETGNALMTEAVKAASNASARAETTDGAARSQGVTVNEVTP